MLVRANVRRREIQLFEGLIHCALTIYIQLSLLTARHLLHRVLFGFLDLLFGFLDLLLGFFNLLIGFLTLLIGFLDLA